MKCLGSHFGPRRSCSWSVVVSVDVAVADTVAVDVDVAVVAAFAACRSCRCSVAAVDDVGVADDFLVDDGGIDDVDAVVGVGVAVVAAGVVVVVVAVVVAAAFADDASVADDVLCRLLFPEDDVSVAWR